jgi:hypothetical protein
MEPANIPLPNSWDTEEVRGMISGQIPVTREGLVPFTMFGMIDKRGWKIRQEQWKDVRWSDFTDGQFFLKHIQDYPRPFSGNDWTLFMDGLDTNYGNEDSTESLMNYVIGQDDPHGIVRYEEVCGQIRVASTVDNIRLITNVMQTHPRNTVIQKVTLGILAQMYTYQGLAKPDANDIYQLNVRLAFEILLKTKRDVESLRCAILILVSIHKIHAATVKNYMTTTGHDLMLIVFDIQDECSKMKDLISTCDAISRVFLPTWQAPVSLPGITTRLPIDIIIDYMRQNSGSRTHLEVGSQQLHDLSQKNSDTITLSRQHMRFISKLIDDVNMGMPHSTEDERVYNLWTFLYLCIRNPESFYNFKHVFGVDFLLQSIRYFNKTYENFTKPPYVLLLYTDCLSHIFKMVQSFVNEPNTPNVLLLLEANPFSTFMQTIGTQYNSSRFDQTIPSCSICISILLQIFVNSPDIMLKYISMPYRNGQIVPIKFSYGVNLHIVGKNKTLHRFLWTSLCRMLNKENQIARESSHMGMVGNTMILLLEMSKYWDLVHNDITKCLNKILFCTQRFVSIFGNHITAMPIAHMNLAVSGVYLHEIVSTMDSIILNYSLGMTTHNMELSTHSTVVEQYLTLTKLYREDGANSLAVVFNCVHAQ